MLSNRTHGLVLPAYFELLPWGTFPVFTQRTSCHFVTRRFTYFYRTRTSGGFPRIYTVLSYCQHSFPGNFFPNLLARPVSLPHDRSLGPSPINITRSGLGPSRVDGREGPSLLYPRKAASARPRERLSLGSARNTGTFDFTRTGNQATLTNRVTMCRAIERPLHVYSKAPHGSAYSS